MAAQAIQEPARKQSLFDIGEEINRIASAFDQLEAGGTEEEVLAAIETYFGDLLDKRDEKIDAYVGLYRQLGAEAEICKNESARIATRGRTASNRAERLKTRLHEFLKAHQIERIKTTLNTVRTQANGGVAPLVADPKVTVDDLPAAYVKTVKVADVDAIRKALEAGFEIPGYTLGERGSHVRFD